MNRRSFLATAACLPFLGRFVLRHNQLLLSNITWTCDAPHRICATWSDGFSAFIRAPQITRSQIAQLARAVGTPHTRAQLQACLQGETDRPVA
jgi:hypothetical protein